MKNGRSTFISLVEALARLVPPLNGWRGKQQQEPTQDGQ
jgi:hypothetical protein